MNRRRYLGLMKRRIVFISMHAWLQLMLLSLVDGKEWGCQTAFLYDIEMQLCFLVTLPVH